MHPQPEQRPTASEILQHWTLRRAVWRGQSRRAAYRMVGVYTPVCVCVCSSCPFSFAVVFSSVGVIATVQSVAVAAGPSAGMEGTGGEDNMLLTSTIHWSCR